MQPASYVWTEQYQAAVLELNFDKLPDQVVKADAVIHQRQADQLRETGQKST